MVRTLLLGLLVWCIDAAQGETFAAPDLTKAHKISIWATEYHIHQIQSNSGSIPLLALDGKPLGPQLSAFDFCHAALEGTVIIGIETFNVSGAAQAKSQADCFPIVNRDVGRNRFARSKHAYGDGVRGYRLVPYRTLAADLSKLPVGTLLYIPLAVGQVLPDGTQHDGYFFVADTGDMKGLHIDVFQGLQPLPLTFIHSNPEPLIPAYIVNDDHVRQFMAREHGK